MLKIFIYKNSTPEPVGRNWPQQADEEGQDIYSISTLDKEAVEATKFPKLPRLTLI